MPITRAASTIQVTGTVVIPGPVQIEAVQASAAAITIAKGAVVLYTSTADATVKPLPLRSAGPLTVTAGAGTITLYLRLASNR